MKEKEQSSIEWLISQIKEDQLTQAKTLIEWSEIYEQAKELHKKETMKAWVNGCSTLGAKNAEQYYNEKYSTN